MNNKEDDLSSTVLLVVVVLYVAIVAASFAGMLVTHPHDFLPMMDWAERYGAIIAGVPVLIAVWVAKQQLEANRRQHEATIKRSYHKELDALARIDDFAMTVTSTSWLEAKALAEFINRQGIYITMPSRSELDKVSEAAPQLIKEQAEFLWVAVTNLTMLSQSTEWDESELEALLNNAKFRASVLRDNINDERVRLSENWS